MSVQTSPKVSGLAMSRAEKRGMQITSLLSAPDKLTDIQIAEIVGCSTKSVQRTRNRIKPALAEIEDKLQEYRALLQREVPLEYRARRLRELAEQDEQKMVSLKALERIDAIDGLMGRQEREEVPRVPMFQLPEGSTGVDVTVSQSIQIKATANILNVDGRSEEHPRTIEGEAVVSEDAESE